MNKPNELNLMELMDFIVLNYVQIAQILRSQNVRQYTYVTKIDNKYLCMCLKPVKRSSPIKILKQHTCDKRYRHLCFIGYSFRNVVVNHFAVKNIVTTLSWCTNRFENKLVKNHVMILTPKRASLYMVHCSTGNMCVALGA